MVVVVIAHNPGAWFPETLRSLARQDYERTSLVIVDAASEIPLKSEVARHAPGAELIRLEDDLGGFGRAVNAVRDRLPAGALLALCHDDVAPDPDVITALVEAVVRTNAAVVGPKLVHWDEPERLQHVGRTVDRFGAPVALVEEGELDQGQHDGVADAFVVPGGITLIRRDLFDTLDGFDPGIAHRGEDVDLCWRANLAGATTRIVPSARCRHRETFAERDEGRHNVYYLQLRHAIRTASCCYEKRTLVRLLPGLVFVTIAEFVFSVVTGRFTRAFHMARAWFWNVGRAGQIVRRRGVVARQRRLPDSEVRQRQARGSARVRALVREGDARLAIANSGQRLLASLRRPGARNQLAIVAAALLVLGFGSRHLLTRRIPSIGEFQPFNSTARELLSQWWSGWRAAGGGTDAAAPTAFMMLGVAGTLFFEKLGILRFFLIMLPLLIGPVSMWRFCRALGSRHAQVAGAVLYASLPIAYNGIAAGSLSVLVVYAVLPSIALGLARVGRLAPFDAAPARSRELDVVSLALVTALAAAFVPFVVVIVALIVVCWTLGSLLIGDERGSLRMTGLAAVSLALAALLHTPWFGSFLSAPRTWAPFAGAGTTAGTSHSFADIARLATGPFDPGVLGVAYFLPLVLALAIAQSWRFAWAARSATLAVGAWALQWASARGWLGVALPQPGVVLSAAGFALAFGLAVVMAAIEHDLRTYRLGWRQAVPFVVAAAAFLSVLPLCREAVDGRWGLSRGDLRSSFGFADEPQAGSFRVAWIGRREAMPIAGATLDGDPRDGVGSDTDLSLAITQDRSPRFEDRWPVPQREVAFQVADVIRDAVGQQTVRAGRDLAALGVRYVVLVEYRSPIGRNPSDGAPLPEWLRSAFGDQLDLERIEGVNDAIRIYRNTEWVPIRATVGAGGEITPALESAAGAEFSGALGSGTLVAAYEPGPNWRLESAGARIDLKGQTATAMTFPVSGGSGELRYQIPATRRALLVLQVVLWVVAIAAWLVLRDSARRRAFDGAGQ